MFDTNVSVSALLFVDSVPRQALNRVLNQGTLLISDELAEELRDVLRRPRFNRYISHRQRNEFLKLLVRRYELVEITESVRACRDPKDDKLLELAVNGNGDYIVTGDDDLLALDPFRGIRVIRPAEFLRITGL